MITEQEALQKYNDMLDDCYEMIEVCGYKYTPSEALKSIDPIAYQVGFDDWASENLENGLNGYE